MSRIVLIALTCLLLTATMAMAQIETVSQEEYAAMSKDERMAAKAAAVEAQAQRPFTGTLDKGVPTNPPQHLASDPSRATMGTITYDAGVFDALPTQPAGITDILSFGNQFDTQNGGIIPAPTVTVTQIAAWPALVDGSSTASGSAFFTIFGPVNTAGTNAAPINSTNQPNIQPQAWNTFSQLGVVSPATGTGTAASFLIGIFGAASGGPGTDCDGDCAAFDTGDTVAMQGFHAMRIDDFSGGDFGTIANANALIRAIGNVVPVELMNFSVE
ncbi:MAG: hypothetical protein AAGC60_22720 [Acidobacteriota bacterium]